MISSESANFVLDRGREVFNQLQTLKKALADVDHLAKVARQAHDLASAAAHGVEPGYMGHTSRFTTPEEVDEIWRQVARAIANEVGGNR